MKRSEPIFGLVKSSTEVGKRLPRHIFHGEPRRPVREHVRVVNVGDRRMVQLRERSLLRRKPSRARRRQRAAQELDGDPAADVLALRQINGPHAAFSQERDQAVRAHGLMHSASRSGEVDDLGGRSWKAPIEE